jgi:phosphate:Na+ symporter
MIFSILGGVGLFLLGMTLLTDGLKNLGGQTLKRILSRFAGGPFQGLLTGAALTALVQASSATTIASIGFVSAGIITLPQAISIIFGANLGTTSTGWLVSVLGLKYSLASLALPMVGVGALMRLISKEKYRAWGTLLAGFALIFIGIDTLQDGLSAFSETINPTVFPEPDFIGRLILVGLGMVLTVLMQSSSVAVAMTITALHAGSINLDQAAAMVIGQNIGTTFTTLFAIIGSTVPAKQTAWAHILFNVITGMISIMLLPKLVLVVVALTDLLGSAEPAIILATFHTLFNVLGVGLLLPFIQPFSRFITRIIPDKSVSLTRHLDHSVLQIPAVAIESARLTLVDIMHDIAIFISNQLSSIQPIDSSEIREEQDRLHQALDETRLFLRSIQIGQGASKEQVLYVAVLHAIDHLDSILDDFTKKDSLELLKKSPKLEVLFQKTVQQIPAVKYWLETQQSESFKLEMEAFAKEMAEFRKSYRLDLLNQTAKQEIDPETAQDLIEALRWIDGVWFHLWRTVVYIDTQTLASTQIREL